MMIVELPPGASTGKAPHAHEGEEVHVVIKGKIYAEQGRMPQNLKRVIPLAGTLAHPIW